jgi:hypothetical protein
MAPICYPVYNRGMARRVIHLSEKEAATTNLSTLLAHVRAGQELLIEVGNDQWRSFIPLNLYDAPFQSASHCYLKTRLPP